MKKEGAVGVRRPSRHRGFEQVRSKLTGLAWHKYGIPPEDAAGIVLTTVETFCQAGFTCDAERTQFPILLGVFNRICIEHVSESNGEQRRNNVVPDSSEARKGSPVPEAEQEHKCESSLCELVRREDGSLLLATLAGLESDAEVLLQSLVEEGSERTEANHHRLASATSDLATEE